MRCRFSENAPPPTGWPITYSSTVEPPITDSPRYRPPPYNKQRVAGIFTDKVQPLPTQFFQATVSMKNCRDAPCLQISLLALIIFYSCYVTIISRY